MKRRMKKTGMQALVCVMIFGLLYAGSNFTTGSIAGYTETLKGYLTEDYSLGEIKEEAVSVMGRAVEKPREFYTAVVEGESSQKFISPVDEIAVSVFRQGDTEEVFRYLADESIAVHCSNRGMVEEITEESSGRYTVIVSHDDGVSSRYIGCTKVYIKENERVTRGQIIGEVNNEGIRSLAFEIWKDDVKQNPGDYIQE